MRVLVCWPKVLYERGGTEALVATLIDHLRKECHEVDELALPLQPWPHEAVIRSALLWRLLDLDREDTPSIDTVITTKFPSYYLIHPRKVVWLIHQFRQVYDFYGTPFSGYDRPRSDDYQLVQWIADHDRESLSEARAIYTISENVRKRLKKYLDIDARVLYPPPPLAGRYACKDYEKVVLVVQRLEKNKRTDLILKALARVPVPFSAWIVGSGPEAPALRKLARELDLEDRVQFLGRVSEDELIERYARCLVVVYVPYDEDYGFVPLEAWMSKKPVVTVTDSGGPLEFVRDGINGRIAEPDPESLARAIAEILDDESTARRMGEAGWMQVRDMNWPGVIRVLLQGEAL